MRAVYHRSEFNGTFSAQIRKAEIKSRKLAEKNRKMLEKCLTLNTIYSILVTVFQDKERSLCKLLNVTELLPNTTGPK